MKSNFPKTQLFLSIIFFLLFCFASLFFYKTINNKNMELETKEGQWQKETARREEIKKLDHSVKIIEEERAQLETHFAQSSDVVPFLNTMEGLASKVGARAEVTSVDILKDQNALMVGMKAEGTFSGLYKFLKLLENSPYELEFTGVDMHRSTEISVDKKTSTVYSWELVLKIKLLSFINK